MKKSLLLNRSIFILFFCTILNTCKATYFGDSTILDKQKSLDLIKLAEFPSNTNFKLLYRASRDGFESNDFHSRCDYISKTLTVIKAKGNTNIFGGYTEATWDGLADAHNNAYKQDNDAFLFSLINKYNQPIKMKIKANNPFAIKASPNFGVIFGNGHDLFITSQSNIKNFSYSYLGSSYPHPAYKIDSNEAMNFLAGTKFFSTSEIEVYQVEISSNFSDSSILSKQQSLDIIKLAEFSSDRKFRLLYRATRDGFGAKDFHSRCDGIKKTLTIIKAKGNANIFGGYSEATWNGNGPKVDSSAFLFSLVNSDRNPIKINVRGNDSNAIQARPDYLVTFGWGVDFRIYSESNVNKNSFSNLGASYPHPAYKFGTEEARCFLAGAENFSTTEIEVYEVY